MIDWVAYFFHGSTLRKSQVLKKYDYPASLSLKVFYFIFYFNPYIYPPDSQESDGGANT